MSEIVFARENEWIPQVIREHHGLRLRVAGGADALHDPRTFLVSVSAEHVEVIRGDLERHLLLWSALLPLCVAAGSSGPIDEAAAAELLDPILFGTADDVEALFRGIPWDKRQLIAQGADIDLLEQGRILAALDRATERSDWKRVFEFDAHRNRARRGVRLARLDEALLKYTGRYLHGGKTPTREPDAVDPELLPEVMRVIVTAEQASSGMPMSAGWGSGDQRARKRREWKQIEEAVGRAVRAEYPHLVDDAVDTVSFLMCSEASARAKG